MVYYSAGRKAIFLVDNRPRQVIAEIESDAAYASNLDWTSDSNQLAIADSSGVFAFDLETQEKRYLITREAMGFPPFESGQTYNTRGIFDAPRWSPDERVLLFLARTGFWQGGLERPNWEPVEVDGISPDAVLFAVTANGSHWRALSRKSIPQEMSRDASRLLAVGYGGDQTDQVKYVVDVSWK